MADELTNQTSGQVEEQQQPTEDTGATPAEATSGQEPVAAEAAAEPTEADVKAQLELLQKQVRDLERLAREHQSERDRAKAELEKLRKQLEQIPLTEEQRKAMQEAAMRAELEALRQKEYVEELQRRLMRDYEVPAEVFEGILDPNETMRAMLTYMKEQRAALLEELERAKRKASVPAETPPVPTTGLEAAAPTPMPLEDKSTWVKQRAQEILNQKYGGRRLHAGRAALEAESEWVALQRQRRASKSKV